MSSLRARTADVALEAHVVSHTHWDREWYLPASRFRQRLVRLVDELLDAPSMGGSFLLDGQTILLEDYLEVRPERRAELLNLLARRQLEAGPWYVLPDELIPGAEALVRNLRTGRSALASFAADAPPVLYCPDSFGHPAYLPILASQFGFRLVILWRGFGSRRWPDGDAARWIGPDGSSVLLYHLSRSGYEAGANLPADASHAGARWDELREAIGARSLTGIVLIPNGADHHARQARLDESVAALAKAAAPSLVLRSSLREFADAFAAGAGKSLLPTVRGELRDSYGYTWTLGGTLATRTGQKRRNARVERILVREAEPWAALAHRVKNVNLAPHVDAAWRTLLRVHPHDTLCGCSIDDVARAADVRLDSALTQAEGILADALEIVLSHDAARARECQPMWRSVLTVRNAAARTRGGVAEVELLARIADVPVGPGSMSSALKGKRRSHGLLRIGEGQLPAQILQREERVDRIDSPRHYPDADLVDARTALAWVPPIPGYGTRSWHLLSTAPDAPQLPRDPHLFHTVRVDGLSLGNDLLGVVAHEDGRISIDWDGGVIEDAFGIEYRTDVGDLYTPAPRGKAIRGARLRKQRLIHRGPLRGAIEQSWTLRVPSAAGSRRPTELVFSCVVALDAGSPFVRYSVRGFNTAEDIRLRWLARSGISTPSVMADAGFGPVRRERIEVEADDRLMEHPIPTAPLQRWVAAIGPHRTVALLSDGLAEYEVDGNGEIAVTLVRGVGQLSKSDLAERPGHAAWPVPTPEAQCSGAFAAELALMPAGAMREAILVAIEHAAEDFLHPLTGKTLRSALRLPEATAGFELHGDGLVFSAACDSADGRWTVLRCVNVTQNAVTGRWTFGFGVSAAVRSRLDETPGVPLAVEADSVSFEAGPREVVTILVH